MHAAIETSANASSVAATTPVITAATATMRAAIHPRYGSPDVLSLGEVARPVPRAGEVLVRVHAAGVNIGDHHLVTGRPYLIRLTPFGGLPRPKNRVPGLSVAGRVEAIGAGVTTCAIGDEVFGEAPTGGAFAEYAVLPAERLAPKPTNVTFEEAAATTWAITALQGLRDAGRLKAGQHVLIHGASGGVGGWAVQIAKAMGAEVTGVCSARNVDRVRALGADHVIDYGVTDFVEGGARFDLMFDLVGDRTLRACRSVLRARGTYVSSAGGGGDWLGPFARLVAVFVTSLFVSQRLTAVMAAPKREDLLVLKALVEEGKARPSIERRYPLAQVAEALAHVGSGRTRGQTVLQIAE